MNKDHDWLNKETYDHVLQIIAGWPQWKKDIYKDLIEDRNATAIKSNKQGRSVCHE